MRGGERFFERQEVREALLLLRGQARALDDLPGCAAGCGGERAGRAWLDPRAAGVERRRPRPVGVARGAAPAGRRPRRPRPAGFVAELEERAASQHAPAVDGVTLASLHAAKGLEWDAVFLVGLVDGTLPLVHADTPDQVEEERRLLYVGITRAREHLSLSWALARSPGGRATRRPSRFLDGLLGGRGVGGAGRPRRRGRAGGRRRSPAGSAARCSTRRSTRSSAAAPAARPTATRTLFEALRTWRADRAKDLGQPAYCVFTDATLAAIAERKPSDVAALVTIPGIGQAKLDKFGDDVLALVTASEHSG